MSLRDELNKRFKNGIGFGSDESWLVKTIPTGILGMDKALGGGFAWGRISEIYGPYATGKTLLGDRALVENQKQGGLSIKLTSEMDFDAELFRKRGGNPDTLIVEPAGTVEHVFDFTREVCQAIIKSGDKTPVVMLWDSIAMTGTKHLDKEGLDGSRDMTKAVQMSNGAQLIREYLHRAGVAFISTNQIRDKISTSYRDFDDHKGAKHTPGGKMWPYACSQRVELDFAGGYSGSTIKHDEAVIGRWVRGKIVKNRITSHGRTFMFPIYEQEGFPHPEFENRTTPFGIDLEEALFNYYARSELARVGPEKQQFLYSKGPMWKFADPVVEWLRNNGRNPKAFYKKNWPEVLEKNSELWDYDFNPEEGKGAVRTPA